MATGNASRPPTKLPPKPPIATSSLSDHLARTRPTGNPARALSGGSNMSVASDSSREGLRREIGRRRRSLTSSEFNFLQGVVENGTEFEIVLVQQKLNDPSLGFDVDEVEAVNKAAISRGTSIGSAVHTPIQFMASPSPLPLSRLGQLLCPSLCNSLEDETLATFDPEASIDTCASGRGKPPSIPIPLSPRKDMANFRIPSHAELYPELGAGVHTRGISLDLERTPLVQNLRPHTSLEGAAHLPIAGSMLADDYRNQITPGTDNTSSRTALRPAVAPRRTSNPLVDQLWKAHEQGLIVTPLRCTQRLQHRKEQSLSAVSPLRRYSVSTHRSSASNSSHRNTEGVDHHTRSLLSPEELRLIKQRHFGSQTSSPLPQPHAWRRQQPQMQSLDSKTMMMVLHNTSTDSSTDYCKFNDISALLLPTDEEIFRRSRQESSHQRPPPPRPFDKETLLTKSNSAINRNAPHTLLKRFSSDGVTGGMATSAMPPSALRRMTSDTSQRSKSVSFQIQNRNDYAPPLVAVSSNEMEDSLLTFASEHPATEFLRSSTWNRRDSDFSLNLHHSHPIRQESIGSTASGWDAALAFQQEFGCKLGPEDSVTSVASLNLHRAHPIRQESINSVASLNLHRAHHIRQESIGSTIEGTNANRKFQEELAIASAAASPPIFLLDEPRFGRVDSRSSVASLNLHMAQPIRQDSIASTPDESSALEAFQKQFSFGRRIGLVESLNSLASLDLHIATPIIQDAIFQRQDSLDSTVGEGEGMDLDKAFRPHAWARRESMSSIASLNLHLAHPISSLGRRDSNTSIASLNLHRAHPIRRDSIASVAQGVDAMEAFQQQVATQNWGRRDSCASIASLNLHQARPIRQESISSNAAGAEATESFRQQFLVEPNTVLKPSWGHQSSNLGSVASLNLHRAHAVGSELTPSTIDFLRNKESAFASESDLFELSLTGIPHGRPLRQDSIVSTPTGEEAMERLKKDVEDGSDQYLRIATPGSVLSSESDIAALHRDSSSAILTMNPSSVLSSERYSDSLYLDSLTSIPSLHPAKPIRQDSIASTAAGREAKERLRKQIAHASIVASEWEGLVLPESWEDKKTDSEDGNYVDGHDNFAMKVQARDVPRPVMMRLASNNECDEEGVEVAAVDELVKNLDEENSPQLKLKTQLLVPDGLNRRDSGIVLEKDQDSMLPDREDTAIDTVTKLRQDSYRHFPGSLISFGADSVRGSGATFERMFSTHTIEVSASFDESKSMDRYRGVFRGSIPRSISEDDLSILLMPFLKPKPLSRGQSDATVFPNDLASASWELDTVEGEYDAWDAIRDDYINGYGGGGTLPFQILGTSARDVESQPHVMSPPLMESLQFFFPISKTHDNFWMKYSMVRDGASLHTLMQRARGTKYSILAVETTDGEVFGAFTTEPWRRTWNYYGGGESFLWRMRNSRKTKCYSIIDQAAMESEIDVYPFTGANQCVQLCTHNNIAVGGGSPEHTETEEKRDDNPYDADPATSIEFKDHEWGYGLALQADLQHGSTSPCLTFGSPSLSTIHRDGSLFEILNVELWGLTPCHRLEDAEKLELGRLFLEPSFNPNTFE